MSHRGDDLTSPAGALSAALAALCEASTADEQWRRWQYARTAADYAAEVWWHPASTGDQRAEASRCLKLAYDLEAQVFGGAWFCDLEAARPGFAVISS